MKTSEERILTTHTGSLPRTQALTKLLVAREQRKEFDPADMTREARAALEQPPMHERPDKGSSSQGQSIPRNPRRNT